MRLKSQFHHVVNDENFIVRLLHNFVKKIWVIKIM